MSDFSTAVTVPRSFAFGPFVLIPGRQLLLKHGVPVRIGGRALDILTALVERAGEVISKRELLTRAWTGVVVDDSNLKVNIAALRRVFGELPEAPEYIATISGRGYRFIAAVRKLASSHPPLVFNSGHSLEQRLPSLTRRIVGREEPIDRIQRALNSSRLVSVIGAGGIGKTTVAVAVARLIEDEGLVSVTFVDLSRVTSGEFVPAAIQAALGSSSGGSNGLRGVLSILAGQNALLVLDTCEHVLSAAAHACNFILSATENVRILATSRQVLHGQFETIEWLGPLQVPPPSSADTADSVLRFPAAQLLVERANEMTGFRLHDRDARAVSEISRRLDGSPLALELASARLAGRSASTVLEELDDRFRTLRQISPGGPLRQQTMLATLEWSYALLTKVEATVLRAMSIFAGSFTMESAAAVVAHHNLSLPETFDAISGLRAKSMLSLDQRSDEVLYRMLDTTRAFASDLLDSHGELAPVSASHAQLQLETLTRAGEELSAMPARQWRETFGHLTDDLRKALDWSLYSVFDPMLGVRLVAAGLPLWRELSLEAESRVHCEYALGHLDRTQNADVTLRLKLTVGLALSNTYLSFDSESTIALYRTAIRLAREAEDAVAECRALGALVTYEVLTSRDSDVRESLVAMRTAAIRTDDKSALWDYEQLAAEQESLTSNYPSAILRLKNLWSKIRLHSPDATPAFSNIQQRTQVQVDLGALLWITGKPGEAARLTERAAKEALEHPHGLTLIVCLAHRIIWTMNETHNYERAIFYTECLRSAIFRHGMTPWLPIADCYSEAIAALSGVRVNPEELRRAFDGLRRGMAQLGNHSHYATLARAMLAIGQAKDAAEVVDLAMRQRPPRWIVPELLRLRAATERLSGHRSEAEASLRVSLRVATETNGLSWKLRGAHDLAMMLMDREAVEEAHGVLAPVCGKFDDGLDTGDVRNARKLLSKLERLGLVRA